MKHKDEARGVPCYQHDSYHSECSDCYHPAPPVADSAEDLAREISGMFNDRGRTYDNQPTVEELAALLRSRMGERWIPVSERLPEFPNQYLVNVVGVENGDTLTTVLAADWSGKIWGDLRGWSHNEVTHWRPMPAPPEEER